MDLLYRFEAHLAEPVVIGPVSEGIRLDVGFDGQLTSGTLGEGRVFGTDYLTLRPDGVGVVDARDVFELEQGNVHAKVTGYALPPPGIEPSALAALIAGEPVNAPFPITGLALCQTGIPELAELNRTAVAITGRVNNATRELVIEGRALEPSSLGASADRLAQHAA